MNGLAILALLLVAMVALLSERNTLTDDRQRATRYAVETAWGMVETLGKSAASGEISIEQA